MTNENLPKINKSDLLEKSDDAWGYLSLFALKYFEMINNDSKIIKKLNISQQSLLAFTYLDSEVSNGGFIQLIQNGYGGYIFESPFSRIIKSWGCKEIADIVNRGRILYDKYRIKIEGEKSLEEFSQLYSVITDFEPLEYRYYEVKDNEMEFIKKYIEINMSEFAIIDENNTQASLIEHDKETDNFIMSLIEKNKQN